MTPPKRPDLRAPQAPPQAPTSEPTQDSIIITVDALDDAAQTILAPARAIRTFHPDRDAAGDAQDSIIITADELSHLQAAATLPPADDPAALGDTFAAPAAAPPAASTPGATRGARAPQRSIHDLKRSLATLAPYNPNQVLRTIGEYDVLAELGRGGMGVVYKAYARRLQRFVAIKMIKAGENAPPIAVARFINEAMLAARIQHPNITAVYDSGEDEDGASYFVMEYVEGKDLGHYLEQGLDRGQPLIDSLPLAATADLASTSPGGPSAAATLADAPGGRLSLRAVLRIIEQSARALHHAHEQGIVHRDIKPDNILIDARLQPHLTDFGIAKATLNDNNLGLTTEGDVMGTPYYMAPEQASGDLKAIGPHSDVYSLGATLYHAITSRVMYDAPNAMALMIKVVSHEEPPKPSAVLARLGLPPIPLDLETICLKATEKAVQRRYPTALAFADDLHAFLHNQPISARPLTRSERIRRALQRNRPLLVASVLSASLLITLALAFGIGLIGNLERTSRDLEAQDTQQALQQASTIERAIRVNMLQGRADLARAFVNRLIADSPTSALSVARLDRSPAYSDASTRRQIATRLARPDVQAFIKREFPALVTELQDLQARAFPNIDLQAQDTFSQVPVDNDAWAAATQSGQPQTYIQHLPNDRRELVVLKPIANDRECQACHGDTDNDTYGANTLRAVVVLHRPLDDLDQMLAQNRRSTWIIGASTAAVVLAILFAIARIFGVGLGARRVWRSE